MTTPLLNRRDPNGNCEALLQGKARESDNHHDLLFLPDEFKGSFASPEASELTEALLGMPRRVGESPGVCMDAAEAWENTFNSFPDAILLLDRSNRIQRLNRAAAELLEVVPEKTLGKFCYEVIHNADSPPEWCPHLKTVASGDPVSVETQDSLTGCWFRVTTVPCLDKTGRLTGTVHMMRDITERKQSEKALRDAHNRLDAIIEFLPDATFVLDTTGKIIAWNKAVEKMTGVRKAEMVQRGNYEHAIPFYGARRPMLADLILKPDQDLEVENYINLQWGGNELCGETYAPGAFGCRGAFLWSTASVLRDSGGKIVGAIESIRDITERKQAEEKRIALEQHLQRARKAESIGRIAGGFAHTFNNLIMAVMGNLELALIDLPQELKARTKIGRAMIASGRAAEINRLMATYVGQTVIEKVALDLCGVTRETLSLLSVTLPNSIRLVVQIPDDGPVVLADEESIKQILTNLVLNAIEAIGDRVGDIVVRVRSCEAGDLPEPKDLPLDRGFKECGYACLSVSDTGCGMDGAALESLFEPFYSTKFTGRGLGLPVVHGLVRTLDGEITVESQTGKGSQFRMFIPLAPRVTE
ncbi:MAG: PAS domain-containing protein [Syntrophobacteraceae bacterium]|nr:PAS domain-containing protein [Syntrophobacteraceae bacterium]